MIDNKPDELTLIFHSEKSDDKKARGYVESLPSLAIKTIDLSRESLTETQLAQISDKLKMPLAEMIDYNYDDRKNRKDNTGDMKKMDEVELLTLIVHNPLLLDTPIVILGSKAYKFDSSYELIQQYQSQGVKTTKSANREEKDIKE